VLIFVHCDCKVVAALAYQQTILTQVKAARMVASHSVDTQWARKLLMIKGDLTVSGLRYV